MLKREAVAIIQCGLAVAYGFLVWSWLHPFPESPKTPVIGALLLGFGGSWATMFLYVWLRFGWQAARSMKMCQQIELPTKKYELPRWTTDYSRYRHWRN